MFVIEGINDLRTLSDVIGGELYSNNESFIGITTDSREEVNGGVYLALKGESFDGDVFCKDAIDNGSIAVITDNPETLGRFILVKDTYEALLKIASHHHKQINPKTIAITGSNGKTSVKEMMGKILGSDNTVITKSNENNQFGIPYTILRCKSSTENLVLECGARHDGDFKKIVEHFEFDQLVITNINNSHVGIFGSVKNIIRTKLELIKAVKDSGNIIEAAFKDLSKNRELSSKSNEVKLYDSNDLNLNTTWVYDCERDHDLNEKYLISLNSNKENKQIQFEASIEHNCINAVITSLALSQFGYDIDQSMNNLSGFNNPLKNFYFKYIKRQNPYSEIAVNDLLMKFKENIKIIKGDTNKILKELNLQNIEYIFIDGGHNYNTVKNDLFYSKKFISENGIILCDDYDLSYAPGVKQAIDEFVKENNCKFELILDRFAKIEL